MSHDFLNFLSCCHSSYTNFTSVLIGFAQMFLFMGVI